MGFLIVCLMALAQIAEAQTNIGTINLTRSEFLKTLSDRFPELVFEEEIMLADGKLSVSGRYGTNLVELVGPVRKNVEQVSVMWGHSYAAGDAKRNRRGLSLARTVLKLVFPNWGSSIWISKAMEQKKSAQIRRGLLVTLKFSKFGDGHLYIVTIRSTPSKYDFDYLYLR